METTSKILFNKVGQLSVSVFNVGQGDHILIKLPNGEYGIIDFYYDERLLLFEPPALSFFKELQEKMDVNEFSKIKISFICISHFHYDHLRGANEFLTWALDNNITISNIWLASVKSKEQLQIVLLKNLDKIWNELNDNERKRLNKTFEDIKGENEDDGNGNNFFTLLDRWVSLDIKNKIQYISNIRLISGKKNLGARIYSLGPLDEHLENLNEEALLLHTKMLLGLKAIKHRSDYNLMSHILLLKYFDNNLLFGGDTGKKIWLDCLNQFEKNGHIEEIGNYCANFIKVSHHGSKKSSNKIIWEKIIKKDCNTNLVISAGNTRKYKHPDLKTISDVFQVAKKNVNNKLNIFSTNICERRVNDIPLHKTTHNFIINSIKREKSIVYNQITDWFLYKKGTSEKMSSEIKEYTECLLGYEFKFSSENPDDIEIEAMMTSGLCNYKRCNHVKKEDVKCHTCKLFYFAS